MEGAYRRHRANHQFCLSLGVVSVIFMAGVILLNLSSSQPLQVMAYILLMVAMIALCLAGYRRQKLLTLLQTNNEAERGQADLPYTTESTSVNPADSDFLAAVAPPYDEDPPPAYSCVHTSGTDSCVVGSESSDLQFSSSSPQRSVAAEGRGPWHTQTDPYTSPSPELPPSYEEATKYLSNYE